MDLHHGWYSSAKPLFFGFVLSLIFLIASYVLVAGRLFENAILMPAILIFAGLQAIVQLIWFMHLGIEDKPRWNLISFLFLVGIIIVVIGGSIWIMYNLDYNVMPSMES